jgi:hypothetical protein
MLCRCLRVGIHNRSHSSASSMASGDRRYGPCHGYVIDHIVPLACKGADAPSNMQWQTIADAKFKDHWERNCELWWPQ